MPRRRQKVAVAQAAKYPQHQDRQRYNSGNRRDSTVVNFSSYTQQNKHVALLPKTTSQEYYVDLLTDWDKLVVFATGPAGTGKTMLAVLAALQAYRNGDIQKIVITRPAVGVDDEKHGFLPGDLNSKMEPWTRPIFDVMQEYFSIRELAQMLEEQIIEISPLAFLRGRTFKNSWIIFDEAQNSTLNQMKMVLTRLGENSKMVVTGDLAQHDRKFVIDNGLKDFIQRLSASRSDSIAVAEFGIKDVQRHPVVREVLTLYGEI